MKQELTSDQLEMVTGGTVVVTSTGKIGFTTLGKMFTLNIPWREARKAAEEMLDNNPQMNDKEFDQYVMDQFLANGWI